MTAAVVTAGSRALVEATDRRRLGVPEAENQKR
eukprot:COSAG06_NODE_69628_length_197_cov_13.755102_1_plen_32_part_10